MSSLWTWEIIAATLALIVSCVFGLRSGRLRNRMSGVFFWVAMLLLSGALVTGGLLLDSYLSWKRLDDVIAALLEKADQADVKTTESFDDTYYEISNPSAGIINIGWKRRPFVVEFHQINGLFHGVLISLIACVVRYLSIRQMGNRLLHGHCYHCGYDLTGNQSGVCTECGQSVDEPVSSVLSSI